MLNVIKKRGALAMLLCTLLCGRCVLAEQAVISLEALNKSPSITLSAAAPSQTIYLTKPLHWTLNQVNVRLHVQASPVVLGNSSLTADINGVPIASRRLSSEDALKTPWEIRIPANALGEKLIALNIRAYLKVDDNRCQDSADPAIWVNILGQSEIVYDYRATPAPVNWTQFPQPFIDKNNLWSDKISLYVGEQTSMTEFTPYLNLVHLFAQQSSWRGVDFSLAQRSTLKAIPAGEHAVIIGTGEELAPFIAALGLPMELDHGRWLIGQKNLAPSQGFAWLGHPKQQPDSTILVISADNPQGIEETMTMLGGAKPTTRPKNALWLSQALQHDHQDSPDLRSKRLIRLGFSELGLGDLVAYGQGSQGVQFDLDVPFSAAFGAANLTLDYSYTPFISPNEPSYLEFKLNGQPVGGILLRPNVQTISQHHIAIPPDLLLPGANHIQLGFDLALPSRSCDSGAQNQSWGIIYKSSSISLIEDAAAINNQSNATIRFYPFMLSPNLLIRLPRVNNIWEQERVTSELITLVSKLTHSQSLRFSTESAPEVPDTFNLLNIDFGLLGANPAKQQLQGQVEELAHALQESANFIFKNIDYAMLEQSFTEDKSLGLIGVDFQHGRYNMAVYGLSSNDLVLALKLINNDYRRNLLSGNLAIAFSNDTFTNLNTREIAQAIREEQQKSDIGLLALKFLVFTLLASGLLLALFLFWRSLKNKST